MSDEEKKNDSPRRPLFSVPGLAVLFIGIIAIIFAVTWSSRHIMGALGEDLNSAVSGVFHTMFHVSPKTTVNSGSTVMEKANISELAVTQRKMRTIVTYRQAWLGSTKVLVVQGDFLVKAGFDLHHSFRFTTNPTTKEVVVDLSAPKILSTDFVSTDILYSSDGVINKLNPEDSTAVVRQMLAETKLQAQKSDMLEEAKQQVTQRLEDLLRGTAAKVTVRFHDGPLPTAPVMP